MAFTIGKFKSLIDSVGGAEHILGFGTDADTFQVMYWDKDHLLDVDKDFVVIDGTEYVISHSTLDDKRPHLSGVMSHTISTYHLIENIQRIYVLQDVNERDQVDKSIAFEL